MSRSGSAPPAPPATVLLGDDQPMIAEAVRRMLEPEGDIAFHYCQDPTQALRMAEAIRPTVILQDLVMPDVEGLMLLRFFRKSPATASVPIVVLSTKEEPVLKARAFEDGASDYIVKLPDRLELVARIRHHSAGHVARLERDEAHARLAEKNARLRQLSRDLHKTKEYVRKKFGQYVSDEIAAAALDDPEGPPEKRKVTMLMSDLRGFTSTCERIEPEQVVQFLNNYLGRMADVVFDSGGAVDEFIGDAIFALFGAPRPRPDHAERAVACALRMQLAMDEVNATNRSQGLPEFEMGIAVHTGEVVAGEIGSDRRTKYAVVGAHVNLTARIESNTVGQQILASDDTCREVGLDRLERGRTIRLTAKGFKDPIVAHEIRALQGRGDFLYSTCGTPQQGATRLALPEVEDRFVAFRRQFPVRYALLEGKKVGADLAAARMLSLSRREAVLETPAPVEPLSNMLLRLEGVDADLYAKVVESRPGDAAGRVVVRFTSVAPEVETILARLRTGEAGES